MEFIYANNSFIEKKKSKQTLEQIMNKYLRNERGLNRNENKMHRSMDGNIPRGNRNRKEVS